jgi:hypothetical protein
MVLGGLGLCGICHYHPTLELVSQAYIENIIFGNAGK